MTVEAQLENHSVRIQSVEHKQISTDQKLERLLLFMLATLASAVGGLAVQLFSLGKH
jgi:hypothetical protein